MKRTWKITGDLARRAACAYVHDAPEGHFVTIGEPSRNLSQNAAQWPILEAFSQQLQWPINGAMTKISPDDWKDIMTCAFRNEQPRVAQGLNGGMVLLGQRTSQFSKREFSDWLEFLWTVAVERGVVVYQDDAA